MYIQSFVIFDYFVALDKDVIAVRKRKLRRELDKRKGILLQLFDGTVSGKLAELDSFLRNLEEVNGNFYRSLEFPIAQSVLKVALTNHETMVLAKVKLPHYDV